MPINTHRRKPGRGDVNPAKRPYQPRGGCAEFFRCKDPEVVAAGPAGTGKSMAALSKIYLFCDKYPGTRVLICRKTRESMTQSVLVTWEEKVLPEGHPALKGPQRETRKEYVFPNGSVVVIGGLRQSGRDQTQKIMSTDYDMIYIPEAIELVEEEWEKATTRLRNNKAPYQQLIADTNPSGPQHWLKKRSESGKCRMVPTYHTDNPLLWDVKAERWTDFGAKYIEKLDRLTGARRDRLRFGLWRQAEGAVYEEWDEKVHVRTLEQLGLSRIPKEWRRFISIDWGFTNPAVIQWWAADGDGRLYLYREFVHTQMRVEHLAAKAKLLTEPGEEFEAIIADHDAEDRDTWDAHFGQATIAARKSVMPGIQAMQGRLAKAGDGRPRLYVLADALVSRDEQMLDENKPAGLVAEIGEYVWDRTKPERPKEEPIPVNDHSCDAARYMVAHLEGSNWLAPKPLSDNSVEAQVARVATDWRKKGSRDWRKYGSNPRQM